MQSPMSNFKLIELDDWAHIYIEETFRVSKWSIDKCHILLEAKCLNFELSTQIFLLFLFYHSSFQTCFWLNQTFIN